MVSPMQRRKAVEMVVCMGLCSRRKACRTLGLQRSTLYHRCEASPEKLAEEGLVEAVSRELPTLGYEKVAVVLREEHGRKINRKRVARIRRERGLKASRKQQKRHRIHRSQSVRRTATRPDEVWSYDFTSDVTVDGRVVRILSVIDEYTRECLLLRAARSFPARRVIAELEEVMGCSGRKPEYLRSDNGPEFIAKIVQKWLGQAGIGPEYITPGAPWENGHVESFHNQLKQELLNRELFYSVGEAHMLLCDWKDFYNHRRPHGSLKMLPPAVAAQREQAALEAVPAGVNPNNN